MLDRQQVEQVLLEHIVTTNCPTTCCPSSGKHRLVKLRDDLCALSPAPSREILEKILHEAAGGFSFHSELFERIWAWATGTPQREEVQQPQMGSLQHQRCMACGHCMDCPSCATPRPQNG